MMEVILKISAAALIGALLALVQQKQAPESAMLTAMACGLVILYLLLGTGGEIARCWTKIAARIPYADEIAAPLWKAVGISITARLASALCRDCGQSALGAKVELAGTAGCIVTMLPMAERIFDWIAEVL